jgi:membrane peptidoglycan carboxypeptidase
MSGLAGRSSRRRASLHREFGAFTLRRHPVRMALALLLILGVAVAASGLAFDYATRISAVPTVALPADTLVYARDGQLIADLHPPGQSRIPVPLSAISPAMQQAIVAVEDRNFWHEGSIDWTRVAASALYDLRHGQPAQGASTIPEQLAKILYLNEDKTLQRKLNEVVLGQVLSSRESKQQVLDDYLNDVYFGEGATGVQAAAEVYFGEPASKLDVAQAALLAGLPNAPSALDPFVHPAAAKARQAVVLDAMVRAGDLAPSQRQAALEEPLRYSDGKAVDVNAFPAFTSRVVQELSGRFRVDPRQAGLRVVTTLDPRLQRLAQQAVTTQVAADRWLHATDGAAVVLDPSTGDVLAYVGSAGPSAPGNQIDMAARPRQPGSTMKVFTYAAAIAQKKITMLTPISDAPLTLPNGGQPFTPHDYDYRYHGVLPAAEALGNSLNIPAVRVEMQVGVPSIVQLARSLGVTTLSQPPSSYGPSLTLGGYAVPLWEMAQAYDAFADGGTYHPARFLLSVRNGQGQELLTTTPAGQPVIDPGVAFIMNQMLSDNANRVMEFGVDNPLVVSGHQVAAKTGTTNDNRDALTIGWTPHLLAAVWVGNADNRPMDAVVGATGAAPIWHRIMAQGLPAGGDGWPSAPSDVHRAWMDGRWGWFLDGTGPSQQVLGGGFSPGSSLGPGSEGGPPDRSRGGGDRGVRGRPGCRIWTYQGGTYWSCASGPSGLPGDPEG